MTKDTQHFRVSEFTCKCGCGLNLTDQRLIDLCEKIRSELGVPVRVSSGTRCERHNARVGGVKGSYHTQGLAADLTCGKGGSAISEAIHRLDSRGDIPDMSYCIWYKNRGFVHVDVGKTRRVKYEVR